MPHNSRPQASLSRSTLVKMGVRIAAVIAMTTLLSYLHVLGTVRAEHLERLASYVAERAHREEIIFLLAEDNHVVLRDAFTERLQQAGADDARFARLVRRLPDGTWRNAPESFDGRRMPGIFIPRELTPDADLRHRVLAAYDVLSSYGPAFHPRFTNTYIVLPEGVVVLYWPERPTYFQDAASDFSILSLDFLTRTVPENNPTRHTVWCDVYADPHTHGWMVTVATPVDVGGRHVATLGNDVLLAELMERASQDHLPGAYNMILGDEGQPIVHPELAPALDEHPQGPTPLGTEGQRERLRRMFAHLQAAPGQTVVEEPEEDAYLGHARLEGPGWNLVTVLPTHVVSKPAVQAARYVLVFGMASLLLELGIMSWVLRRQITEPLSRFTQATDRVASGETELALDTARQDELGQLAGAFRRMADQVRRREEELRLANDGLERRVAERTQELTALHGRLVEAARREGMAEIATNVLHNVGNVLSSVTSSTQLARERLHQLRIEPVGRMAALLREHQADLSAFLGQDERGRVLLPFMDQLGQHLAEERQRILALLDEVGRYTEHIGDIITVQQDHARTPRTHQPVVLAELVEDALRLDAARLAHRQVKVERRMDTLPPVLTDKHKVLMILINLISNARHALDTMPADERLITIRLDQPSAERFRVEIRDNGIGIAPELLARIFQHGFTTRAKGHGFGLHSAILAAQELGGSLTAHSEGPGRGATFTLELPCRSVPAPPSA